MANIHIKVLTNKYGKNAEKWKTEHDDRKLYSNIFINFAKRMKALKMHQRLLKSQ